MNTSFGEIKNVNFNFDFITKFFEREKPTEAFQILSDKTCNDLDFEELFMFLDRTCSKVGQQYLYYKLRVISSDFSQNELNETIINSIGNDNDFRQRIHSLLKKLNSTNTYFISSLFQESYLKKPSWFIITQILSIVSFFTTLALFFYPQFILLYIPIFGINLIVHYWNKRNITDYIGALPQLLKLTNTAKNLYKIQQLQKIDESVNNAIKAIDKLKNRMSIFRLEANLQGDPLGIAWSFLELVKITFLIEPILFFNVLNYLDRRQKEIKDVFLFVGHVDFLLSIASLRKNLSTYCLPVIKQDFSDIHSTQLYHPLIINCVANDLALKDKSVLLTGSNMSGKTSFIRAIGLNVISGLTLNTCFAEEMIIPLTRIFSAIRISDDLMNDKSYYFEEVLSIKEMMEKGADSQKNLFLLDEIFKGTNTIERISAGKAVLSELAKNGNIVFVSTHDIELTDLLSDEYDLYHFSEIVTDNNVDFDYKLKEGKLKNRNAIRILQINDYPKHVIEEAISISEELDEKNNTV